MNKYITLFYSILIFTNCFLFFSQTFAQSLPITNWHFKKGDKKDSKISSNQSDIWYPIQTGIIWEKQGFIDYDGVAWYKCSIFIPEEYKKYALENNGLQLEIQSIDDADETFINDQLVGKTGSMPPNFISASEYERSYYVPVHIIKWDSINELTIKIYDGGGGGGITGDVVFRVRNVSDEVEIEFKQDFNDNIYANFSNSFPVSFNLSSQLKMNGEETLTVVTDFGDTIYQKSRPFKLNGKNEKLKTEHILNNIQSGIYVLYFEFIIQGFSKKFQTTIAVKPELFHNNTDLSKINDFWKKERQIINNHKLKTKMQVVDSLSTNKKKVYIVSIHSIDKTVFKAWYVVPKSKSKKIGLIKYGSYTESTLPELTALSDSFAVLTVDIRGHGMSKSYINPGFPGYLTYGVKDKDTYIYKGAYTDAALAVAFLDKRPEIQKGKIIVSGKSQGAALSVAAAMLMPQKVIACALSVPFLSDFPTQFRLSEWPKVEFEEYALKNFTTLDSLSNTLSYFDITNLAHLVSCNVLLGLGLLDKVCPPRTVFRLYNQFKGNKAQIVYPNAGHGLPLEFEQQKLIWMLNLAK